MFFFFLRQLHRKGSFEEEEDGGGGYLDVAAILPLPEYEEEHRLEGGGTNPPETEAKFKILRFRSREIFKKIKVDSSSVEDDDTVAGSDGGAGDLSIAEEVNGRRRQSLRDIVMRAQKTKKRFKTFFTYWSQDKG